MSDPAAPSSTATGSDLPENDTNGIQEPKAPDVEAPKPAKPRARLGPMEIVQLPGSDSEPEDDDDTAVNTEEEADEDLLRDFPDDAEVSFPSL